MEGFDHILSGRGQRKKTKIINSMLKTYREASLSIFFGEIPEFEKVDEINKLLL